ncbi:MAG TPA: TetR/AcrR family transcriptional regulator [Polyangiales bacterium]
MTSAKLDPGAQADAFRERIVSASTELIEEQGLAALSMREVARRAGVSHQAPYYYFADREAILGAIAEQGFRMLGEHVQQCSIEGEGVQATIVAAGRAYLEFALAHPAHFRVMFRPELVMTERHPNVSGEGVRACDTFYQIVREAVAAGLPANSVDALFLLCWSVGHGLACLALDGPLDVVMPHVDRKAQLSDVLSQFDAMMAASVAHANAASAVQGKRAKASPTKARKAGARKTKSKVGAA